jgi:hypothetical protein
LVENHLSDSFFANQCFDQDKSWLTQQPSHLYFGLFWLYHPLDDITNLKYKLLRILAPNKNNFKEKGSGFKPG